MSYVPAKEILEGLEKIYHIELNEPLCYEDFGTFDPIIYNNEPYEPAETIKDLTLDWLNTLNILREKYLETDDIRFAHLLYELMPVGVYDKLSVDTSQKI